MSLEPGPPDWQLERYRLGELPLEQGEAVRRWLAHNDGGGPEPTAAQRLAALEHDDVQILDHYPPHQVAAQVRSRLAGRRPPRRGRPRPMPVLAAGAALAACLAVLIPGPWLAPLPATRVKGLTPHLLVFRQRPAPVSEVERLVPGSIARHHDLVQLAYQGAGRRYGVIVSIDGRGLVTRHLPENGPQAVPLEAGPVALPQSYELDDAPAFESFYLVAADAPFAVEAVVEAVRRRHARGGDPGPLDLPPSMDQATFVLRKEPVS